MITAGCLYSQTLAGKPQLLLLLLLLLLLAGGRGFNFVQKSFTVRSPLYRRGPNERGEASGLPVLFTRRRDVTDGGTTGRAASPPKVNSSTGE